MVPVRPPSLIRQDCEDCLLYVSIVVIVCFERWQDSGLNKGIGILLVTKKLYFKNTHTK